MEQRKQVLVVGDVMLDETIYGPVHRISPEAPIPVVSAEREDATPGGAANVAKDLAALGAKVLLFSMIGDDPAGHTAASLLDQQGIDRRGLLLTDTARTTRKVRIVGNHQQIVRVDYNDKQVPERRYHEQLIAALRRAVKTCDTVVISDYGKGICSSRLCREVILACREAHVPVLVDPKGTDWTKYAGATVLTPNFKEICGYANLEAENTDEAVERLFGDYPARLGVSCLVVTRSEKGISVLTPDGCRHYPARARMVYDVTGAGDVVAAVLGVCLAPDLHNLEDAVIRANIAAGLAVEKPGTAAVTMEEIDREVQGERLGWDNKVMPPEQLLRQVGQWRRAGCTIVTTNGCFDLLHPGHLRLLREAAKAGDKLIVAINSDDSVRRLKGQNRPVNPESDRAAMLAALPEVDAVTAFSEDTPEQLLRQIRPDVHVKGGDYRIEDLPEAAYARRILLVDYAEGYSTTRLLERMAEGTDPKGDGD